MRTDDWPAIRLIYEEGIATGNATFETDVPTWAQWDAAHISDHRLVAVERGSNGTDEVIGWIAASPVSARPVYRGVVEHSVYVSAGAAGRGVARQLLDAFIASTEAAGIWTIQSGVFPENEASLKLHEACGFRVVGRKERIGEHFGRWRDVILIERRSPVIGHTDALDA